MIRWKTLTRQAAAINLEKYFQDGNFFTNIDSYPEYRRLPKILREAYESACTVAEQKESANKRKYRIDLEFGLRLYEILNRAPYSMKIREASDDGIWRFLSVEVVPDIIYKRWADGSEKVPIKRYYQIGNRNYLKTLWWYVHLSYQKDEAATRLVLSNNSTDTIQSIVDRTGKRGYNVALTREILRAFSYPVGNYKPNDDVLFRKIMVLNTAWSATIEPALFNGGIPGYVKELYSHFSKK